MKIRILSLILWGIGGLMILFSKKSPTKFEYGMVWSCLLLEIITKVVTEWK